MTIILRLVVWAVAALMIGATPAWALSKHTGVVQDQNGRALTSVSITVRDANSAIATIYSDDGVTALANPFTNDSNGSYEFYAAVGRYTLTFVKTGFTFTPADTSDITVGVIVDNLAQASLPAAGTTGRLARVTTGCRGLWMDHGSAWLSVRGHVANIVDFGAHANSSTNNSVAIQAALDTGCPVYVPPSTQSFNFATTLSLPRGATIFGDSYGADGLGSSSSLTYTGTGSALTINAGGTGAASQWAALIRGIDLRGTSSTNGLLIHNATDIQVIGSSFSGFVATPGGAAIRATTTATGGVSMVTLLHNNFSNNSSAVFFDTTAGGQNENWRLIGNRVAGNVATGGRNAALDFTGPISSMLLVGNDINTNLEASEIYFGNDVLGLTISGNYINTASAGAVAVNAIRFAGTGTQSGISITGNEFFNSVAAATGRAIWFSGAGGTAVTIRGNYINAYAAAANTAIDPGGFNFTDSDFSGNSINGAGTAFGTFGATTRLAYPGVTLLGLGSTTNANLGTPANGTIIYCSDCTKATPCAGGGTGAFARRANGAWDCD